MKTVKIYMVRKPSDIDEVMELCRRYNAQAEEVTGSRNGQPASGLV